MFFCFVLFCSLFFAGRALKNMLGTKSVCTTRFHWGCWKLAPKPFVMDYCEWEMISVFFPGSTENNKPLNSSSIRSPVYGHPWNRAQSANTRNLMRSHSKNVVWVFASLYECPDPNAVVTSQSLKENKWPVILFLPKTWQRSEVWLCFIILQVIIH